MCILIEKMEKVFNKGKDLSLLFIRLVLAYGMYVGAKMKALDIDGNIAWFANDLHIPFPTLSVYLAGSTEALGAILLLLGLCVRFISIPLMVIMVVAMFTAHIHNGFPAAKDGYEIVLYYLLMLFVLVTHGGGKYGIDGLLSKKSCDSKQD